VIVGIVLTFCAAVIGWAIGDEIRNTWPHIFKPGFKKKE
jgi:hypothetical protein